MTLFDDAYFHELTDADIDGMDEDDFSSGYYAYRAPREDITCIRCGATGLHWTDDGRRWRLAAPGGDLHVCSNDSAIDDFEVIGK